MTILAYLYPSIYPKKSSTKATWLPTKPRAALEGLDIVLAVPVPPDTRTWVLENQILFNLTLSWCEKHWKIPIFNTSTSESIILSGWSVQTSTRFYNYHLVNTNDTNDTSKFNPRHWEVGLSSRRLQDVSHVWHWQVSCDLLHYQVGSHHGHQVECPPRYLRVTQHHCITLIFFVDLSS